MLGSPTEYNISNSSFWEGSGSTVNDITSTRNKKNHIPILISELSDILDFISEPFADLFPVDTVLGVSLAVLIDLKAAC